MTPISSKTMKQKPKFLLCCNFLKFLFLLPFCCLFYLFLIILFNAMYMKKQPNNIDDDNVNIKMKPITNSFWNWLSKSLSTIIWLINRLDIVKREIPTKSREINSFFGVSLVNIFNNLVMKFLFFFQ
jgi:hypothetical protein